MLFNQAVAGTSFLGAGSHVGPKFAIGYRPIELISSRSSLPGAGRADSLTASTN